ncbi:centromere protein F isoform X2 [Pleurodeles waltl]|uniref:centromere protein F isoform X2 n=1 Tax=Pleurodeles waltl TaxID=8319 RepID=UPI003709A85A
MSWAVEEWKDGLPAKALQKIQELESQLEKLKKERQQRQFQFESLEAAFQKEKQKADKERNEASALKRENQNLIEVCANLEKVKEKIVHDYQLKESQANFLDGQVAASKKQIERMEQDIKRYQSDLEKSQQTLMAIDFPPGGTPQKSCIAPFTPTRCQNDPKFEELLQKYNREVEERKKLEAELKNLQAKKVMPPLSQNMNHREIARNQASSSVFSWQQEQTVSCLTGSSQVTPLKRGYNPSPFSWESEGTPSKQMFRTEQKDHFSENCQSNDSIKMLNQELRSKVKELEVRLEVHEKDLKNNMNRLHEAQLQLEKANAELAEKDRALNKSRDEIMRMATQFDQEAAKCTSMEQKVKKLSEELGCQRQNSESARCSMEQKMKEKDKEYQAELLRQQQTQQMLEQECNQLKSKLTQESQQAKNDYNSLQAEMDKGTTARKQLEKDVEDFKQMLCKSDQALQASLSKENDLQKKLEELKKEGNVTHIQFDQKSREAIQLEEELKTTRELLKLSQDHMEELTKKNLVQEAELKGAQEKLKKQDDPLCLENLKDNAGVLENKLNYVQDPLMKKDLDNEEIKNKLIKMIEHSENLKDIISEKEKEFEELKKENLSLLEWKSERELLNNQLTFERQQLLSKLEVLEQSLSTQKDMIESLEMEKETLSLKVQNLNTLVENKCVEVEHQKQAFVEFQQKAEYEDQKHKKEKENLSLKIIQYAKQIEDMDSSILKGQLTSLEVSLQSEKQLSSELLHQVGELLKNQAEVEKRLSEAEKTYNDLLQDTHANVNKLQEESLVHQTLAESTLEDKEKQLTAFLKKVEIQGSSMQSLQNNNKILIETMEEMNSVFASEGLEKENVSKMHSMYKEDGQQYAAECGNLEHFNFHWEKKDPVETNLYFANCVNEKVKTISELFNMYRDAKQVLLERCKKAEQEYMLLQKNCSSLEERKVCLEALLNERANNFRQSKLDLEQRNKMLNDNYEESISKCFSLENNNIELKKELEALKPLLHQNEMTHIHSTSSKEIDCLRKEINECKAEQAQLIQQNQQLADFIHIQSEQLTKNRVDFDSSSGTKELNSSLKEKDSELNKIQAQLELLQMSFDQKVSSAGSCDKQVTKAMGSLINDKIALEDSELEQTLIQEDLDMIGKELISDKYVLINVPLKKSYEDTKSKNKLFENECVSDMLEVTSNSVVNFSAGQNISPHLEADLAVKLNALDACCQIFEKSLNKIQEQCPTYQSTKTEDLHELKQAIESSRIQLVSLRKQYLCEKDKWQQTLKNLTREMETKLAAEKQQTEFLSLQLETARFELQCLDLSARSIICTDSEDTSQVNFKPEGNGFPHQHAYERNDALKAVLLSENINKEVKNISATLILQNQVKQEECSPLKENSKNSSNCSTMFMDINPKSSSPVCIEEHKVITVDNLVDKQHYSNTNLIVHEDIGESKSEVSSFLIENKDLLSRLDANQMELKAKVSTVLQMEIKIMELENEKKTLLEKTLSMSSENEQLSHSLIDLRNNLVNVTSELEMYKVQQARELLSHSEGLKGEWKEKYLQIEIELKRTKSEKANIENHALALEADFEELHVKSQKLQNENDNKHKLISSIEEKLTSVTAEKNQLNQELCNLAEEHEELGQMHQKLKEKVKELESWKVDSSEFIKILEAEIKTHKNFHAKEWGVNELSVENGTALCLSQQFEKSTEVHTVQTEDSQNQIKALMEEKEMLLKASEVLKKRITELECENIKFSTTIECILNEKIEIVSKLKFTEGEVAQIQNAMETMKICVESHGNEKKLLVEKLKESEQISSTLLDKVESLQLDLEISAENLETMKVQVKASQKEIDSLKSFNGDMTSKTQELNLECASYRTKNEELNAELRKIKRNLSELETSQLTITDILKKHEDEKEKMLQESKCVVSQLQSEVKVLQEELSEKSLLKQEFEKNTELQTLMQEELQNRVGQLMEEKEVLIKATEGLQMKLDESESEKSRLSQSLKCVLTEKREIISQLNSTQEEVAHMRCGIEKLKLHIESDEKKKHHLIEKLKQSEKKTDSLKDKIKHLERGIVIIPVESSKEEAEGGLKEDQTEKFMHLNFNTLREEKEKLNKELQRTLKQLSEFEASQLKIANIMERHEAEKAKLLEESSTSVSSLQTQLKYLQEEVSEKNKLIRLNQELERRSGMQRLQNEELQSNIEDLNEEKGRLLKDSETLKARLADSESEISRLSKAFECALCERRELEMRLTSFQEETSCMHCTIEHLKIQIESKEKDNKDMIENLKQSQRKADSLQDKIENLERNMLISEENLEDAIIQAESSKEEADNLKTLNSDLTKKLKDLEFELHTIKAKHEYLITELNQTREQVSKLEVFKSHTVKMLDQYEKEKIQMLADSTSSVSSPQTQIEELNKQLLGEDIVLLKQEFDKNAAMQIARIQELLNQNQELIEEKQLLLQTSETLRSKSAASESEVSRLSSALECIVPERSDIETKLKSSNDEVVQLKMRIEALMLQIASIEKEKQVTVERLKQSEWAADSLRDKIESLERNLVMADENLEDLIIQLESTKEEVESLKALKEDMTQKQEGLNAELEAARAKNEVLNKELKQTQKQASQACASQEDLSLIIQQHEPEKVRMKKELNTVISLGNKLKDLSKLNEQSNLVHLGEEDDKNTNIKKLQLEELQNEERQLNVEKELLLQNSETLKARLNESEAEISRLSSALETILSQKGDAELRLASSHEDVTYIKNCNESLKLQMVSIEKEKEDMIGKHILSQRKVDLLQVKVRSLEQNVEQLMIQTEASKQEAENLKALKKDLMEKQDDLVANRESDRIKSEVLIKELQQTKEKVAELKASQLNRSQILEQSEQEKGDIEYQSKSLLEDLNKQIKENDSLLHLQKEYEKNAEMHTLQIEELHNQVRGKNKDIDLLSQTSEILKSKLIESESEIAKLSKSLECALEIKVETELKLTHTQGQVTKLQCVIDNLTILQESIEKDNLQLSKTNQETEQKVNSLLAKIESIERDLHISEENEKHLYIQTEKLTAEKEDLNEKLRQVGLELVAIQEEKEDLHKELEQTQAKISQLEISQSLMSNLEKSIQEKIKGEEESKSYISSLKLQLKNVSAELDLFCNEQKTLKSKGEGLASQLASLEQDKTQLLQQLKETQSNHKHLQSSCEELTNEKITYESRIKETTQTIIMLQQQVTCAEQCKENLESALEAERGIWAEEKKRLQRYIDELEQNIEAMSAEKQTLRDTAEIQQVSLINYEKEITSAKSEKFALVDKVTALTEDCLSLKSKISTVSRDLEKMQEEFNVEKNALVDKLRLTTEKEELSKVQLDLVTSEKAVLKKNFDSSQKEYEHQIEKLEQEIKEYRIRIQKADADQEVLLEKLHKQHEVVIQAYEEKLAAAEQSLSAQKLEIHILKSSKDELNESLKLANLKLEENNQTKMEKLKTTVAQLQKENKASRGKLELFTKSYKQLEQEKESLQKHIAEQETVLEDLKAQKKQSEVMDNELKKLKAELQELKEYADEKTKEAEESIEKYCGLLVNQHKLEEANEMLQNRVDFLTAQLKPAHRQSTVTSLSPEKACDKKTPKEKRLSKGPSSLAGKRPRAQEGKEDEKGLKTNTPKNMTKRAKSKINSDALHKITNEDGEYMLEGLPSVVQKGFADIPKGKLSPYIIRRTTLRTSPRIAGQKESPLNPSSQGIYEGLPDIFKPTARLNDAQKVAASSSTGSEDSPLSEHNKVGKTASQDNTTTQKRRRSRSSRHLPQQPVEGENCKVQ